MIRYRFPSFIALGAALMLLLPSPANYAAARPGGAQQQGEGSAIQRLEVMRSRLETMRRSLNGAVAGFGEEKPAEKGEKANTPSLDDPRTRLKGLEREAAKVLSDVTNIRGKQERGEKYEAGELERLEAAVTELNGRVETALRETASARRNAGGAAAAEQTITTKGKKKKRFFGLFGSDKEKYEELISTAAPGRDRELFEEAAKFARKSNYETARILFNVIITTYPESNYLPLAKLAIADTFYREGATSALIQAGAAYRDWLTFFPTDPLADDVMLKMAEAEMRQMGLADRDVTHARKAEHQLKTVLQQFPKTSLREGLQQRLNEVQENLAMHNFQIGRFYLDRNDREKGGLKGAQSRFLEITQKYPNFSYNDEVYYMLAVTYMQEEEPDEAAKWFQRIVRDYPKSDYVEKAKEQLGNIGAPIPDPDPIKNELPAPVRPSFTQNLIREVLGTTPVTISKDGVLLKADGDNDLLQEAVNRGGILPAEILTSPERRAPGRTFEVKPVTTATPNRQPVNNAPAATVDNGAAITAQPTNPGAPTGTTTPAGTASTPNTVNSNKP
ncbi:MAG TPA: outer membrane protein assembly factor BamD [Pyrinomonadaceae bacterium]|jgi:outer membrane protein assembly factor BamD|nr:outer membrane protein assembly factor BamD [Pyrinomonadaceae bacterium]